jgi:hypothetical protein
LSRERRALGEQAHGQRVAAVAEGLGGGLEQGGIAAMGVGGAQPAAALRLARWTAASSSNRFRPRRRQVFERCDAAAGMGDGDLALRAVEGVGELHLGDQHLRHLAVVAGADEIAAGIGLEDHVQDHIAERRVHRVAVRLPGGWIGVEFERAGAQFAIDLHGGLDEIRAGPRFHSPNCTMLTVFRRCVRKSRPKAPENHSAWSSSSAAGAGRVSANSSGGCQTDSNKNP